MAKKKIVVLSGAGISAESGIPTFRASDGLWEGHDVMEVATFEGWKKNPAKVLEFYNQRRKTALNALPNDGHKVLAELEKDFEVVVITQNVDNLHEKAGSTNVVHLHGELFKSRSTLDARLVYDMKGWELKIGDKCEKGSQLRPHIVWFGEAVPMMQKAADEAQMADYFVIVGTSLQVYPAASLVTFVPFKTPVFVVDPHLPILNEKKGQKIFMIQDVASNGMKKVAEQIRELLKNVYT